MHDEQVGSQNMGGDHSAALPMRGNRDTSQLCDLAKETLQACSRNCEVASQQKGRIGLSGPEIQLGFRTDLV